MAHPQHAVPLIRPDGEVRALERAPLVQRMSWALYDFSNTIFSMNVASLYFTVWLVSDLGVSNTTEGVASAVASALSRAASIAGPLIWGITVDSLESTLGTAIAYRAAVMTVAAMFVISALILRGIRDRVAGQA